MQLFLSSFMPFPALSWWVQLWPCSQVLLDGHEHFQKMSYRNRYEIDGANGKILLSIPLVKGRNQRSAMQDIEIFNGEAWQQRHWRTLESVYRRAPYFEHYEPELRGLFQQPYTSLCAFNKDSIDFAMKCLGWHKQLDYTTAFKADYGAEIIDSRGFGPVDNKVPEANYPQYTQVFQERNGFMFNLCILDVLFALGPYANSHIQQVSSRNN